MNREFIESIEKAIALKREDLTALDAELERLARERGAIKAHITAYEDALRMAREHVPEVPDTPAKPKRTINRIAGQKSSDVILKHYAPGGFFLRSKAIEWLTNEGYSKTTISGALNTLLDEKKIARDTREPNRFMFLAKAAPSLSPARLAS